MTNNQTFTYCLYLVLALLIIYFVYKHFFADVDSDDEDDVEEFDNNSSVRTDYGDDRKFSKLSLKEKVDYIKSRQDEMMKERFSMNPQQRNALAISSPY